MRILLFAGIIAVLLISGCTSPQESYSVSQDGTISYTNRPPVNYTEAVLKEDGNATLYKLTFDSKGQKIYALLSVPKDSTKARNGKVPAIFDLYGATMTKEGEYAGLGQDLVHMGFAVLIIDQRGWGETKGTVPSLEQDYQAFQKGEEPVQHRMVYDGLRAYDILKSRPEVDASRIYAAGQSMGGRYAMIAASIEKGIAGALIISSAGYDFGQQPAEVTRFLNSIDPNHYVAGISPRPLIMVQSKVDTVVSYESAKRTYDLAGEPKKLLTTESKDHSYIRADMKEIIAEELENW